MLIAIGDLFIRSFRSDDVAPLVKYANNRTVSANLMERFPFPYTEADARAWLDLVAAMEVETAFAAASPNVARSSINSSMRSSAMRLPRTTRLSTPWTPCCASSRRSTPATSRR